jgi:hypothetical protein
MLFQEFNFNFFSFYKEQVFEISSIRYVTYARGILIVMQHEHNTIETISNKKIWICNNFLKKNPCLHVMFNKIMNSIPIIGFTFQFKMIKPLNVSPKFAKYFYLF